MSDPPDIGKAACIPRERMSKCFTCKLEGVLWEQLCKWDDVKESRETNWTEQVAYAYLKEHFDYPYSFDAFFDHSARRFCGRDERRRRAEAG